jgi:hypothetical protein
MEAKRTKGTKHKKFLPISIFLPILISLVKFRSMKCTRHKRIEEEVNIAHKILVGEYD